jgi:DNA-binding transcriptional regulator YbjK
MMYADEIGMQRLRILVDQYVEVRKRRHDFVSIELASKAIRQLSRTPISDKALENIAAKSAAAHQLEVGFDREPMHGALWPASLTRSAS